MFSHRLASSVQAIITLTYDSSNFLEWFRFLVLKKRKKKNVTVRIKLGYDGRVRHDHCWQCLGFCGQMGRTCNTWIIAVLDSSGLLAG